MYVISRSVLCPDGSKDSAYVIADRICLELSFDIKRAKQYKSKKAAKEVINMYKRSNCETFTIIEI